jgi:hypothetical protein
VRIYQHVGYIPDTTFFLLACLFGRLKHEDRMMDACTSLTFSKKVKCEWSLALVQDLAF